ncbi:MAG: cation-translocating P-type ATPase [Fimbriimonadaceae bacterium]|nr:cation-translocating P-type ATPase [Fimbriimonadaceae bacterium]
MADWFRLPVPTVLSTVEVAPASGLSSPEAARRLAANGPNELVEKAGKSPWRMLWEQFTATMVLILVAAAVISLFLTKWLEAGAILAIVVLFGLLGFFQEYRAEQAMAALRQMAVPLVRVLRDGQIDDIAARELVVGDIVLLEAGNVVPADLRLLEEANLRIQEAALTGESEAVEKCTEPFDEPDLPLGDRRNLAYMGTQVTYGRGRGVVVASGMDTELGQIANLLQGAEQTMTPLQIKLDRVGKSLAVAGIAAAALILTIGLLEQESLQEMFLTAVSVAVAVVPEGLPAVVTVTLALGAQRMLARQALIRKLPAVETLGSVTVICSDKTGTLTENRMTVTVLDVAGHRVDLLEHVRHHRPDLEPEDSQVAIFAAGPPSLTALVAGGALCNDAVLKPDPVAGRYHALGDPTEGALLVAAAQAGLTKEQLAAALPRCAEVPFDSDRKRMTTVHERGSVAPPAALAALLPAGVPYLALTKGAVDQMVDEAVAVWNDGHLEPFTPDWRSRLLAAAERLAGDGMRVLAVACRPLAALPAKVDESIERELVLIGLLGLIDPPRPEVKAAVRRCREAGIRPVMITGDHPLTAVYIARDLGISRNDKVITGTQLAALSEADLAVAVADVNVFARVSPEHKLRIVRALQSRGEIAAMTGDGVNDAPSLRQSDIGVAMGITGTDVSKEASDMVLLDDNFATIVAAVEEGRVIYDNVRRFVKFSIAGNIGKVLVMLLAPLWGLNVALLPLQLLWLNLITDGLLGLGMGVEPAEEGVMRRPPVSPQAGIFSGGGLRHVLWVGLFTGAIALGVGVWFEHHDHHAWQTMTFTLLAFLQTGQALAVRSLHQPIWKMPLRSNRTLVGLAAATFALQLTAIYFPPLQAFLKTEALTAAELGMCLNFGILVLLAVEVEKSFVKRPARREVVPAAS